MKIEEKVVSLLKDKKMHISFAESCTGGLAAARLVNVPDASEVFDMGFITYANEAKVKIIGVSPDMIEKHGVVSCEVAAGMAEGAAKTAGAEVGVGISGIAGPSGGTDKKPVGTVWLGFYVNGKTFTRLPELWLLKNKSRGNIRLAAANYAFGIIEEILTEDF